MENPGSKVAALREAKQRFMLTSKRSLPHPHAHHHQGEDGNAGHGLSTLPVVSAISSGNTSGGPHDTLEATEPNMSSINMTQHSAHTATGRPSGPGAPIVLGTGVDEPPLDSEEEALFAKVITLRHEVRTLTDKLLQSFPPGFPIEDGTLLKESVMMAPSALSPSEAADAPPPTMTAEEAEQREQQLAVMETGDFTSKRFKAHIACHRDPNNPRDVACSAKKFSALLRFKRQEELNRIQEEEERLTTDGRIQHLVAANQAKEEQRAAVGPIPASYRAATTALPSVPPALLALDPNVSPEEHLRQIQAQVMLTYIAHAAAHQAQEASSLSAESFGRDISGSTPTALDWERASRTQSSFISSAPGGRPAEAAAGKAPPKVSHGKTVSVTSTGTSSSAVSGGSRGGVPAGAAGGPPSRTGSQHSARGGTAHTTGTESKDTSSQRSSTGSRPASQAGTAPGGNVVETSNTSLEQTSGFQSRGNVKFAGDQSATMARTEGSSMVVPQDDSSDESGAAIMPVEVSERRPPSPAPERNSPQPVPREQPSSPPRKKKTGGFFSCFRDDSAD